MVDRVHHLGGISKVSTQGMREVRTAADTILGDIKNLAFDKQIIYAKVGAAAISAATVMQAPAVVANHQNIPVAVTASVGAKTVTLALGATSAAANAYEDGILVVTSGAGSGYTYMIEGHPAFAASSSAAKINLKDGLEVALTTASIVSLVANKCNGVVVTADSALLTGEVVGVSLMSAAAGTYVWLGKRGEHACKVISGTVVGGPLFHTTACTTGTLGPNVAGSDQYVGICRQTATSGGIAIVDFKL